MKLASAFFVTLVFSATSLALPDYTLRGFGTLGATHNFSDGAEVIRDISQPDGPANETSFDVDSRLGVQLDMPFSPRFSSTIQAVSRYNYRGKYTPEVTLAFLKYDFEGAKQLRVGRVGWDVYSIADSRDVGYSFLWVRPPVDYFGKLQMDWLDGVDFRFSRRLEGGVLGGKVYAGLNSEKVAISDDSYTDPKRTFTYGGHLEYHDLNWTFRLSYAHVDSENEIRGEQGRQLAAALNSGNPLIIDFLERSGLLNPEIEAELISGALVYDRGPVQIQLMLSHDRFIDTPLGDQTHRGFITASYRIGDWFPYLTYAHSRSPDDPELVQFPGIGDVKTLVEDQYNIGAGVRYNFRENMAVKIQADHFNVRSRGRDSVLWRNAREDWNGEINQLSVTLDFIF